MALAVAPHQPPNFRVLKQAWREYLSTGGGAVSSVTTPPNQPAANPLTVSGNVLADTSASIPVLVRVHLTQGGVVVARQTASANPVSGVWSTVFPAGILVAGTATVTTILPWGVTTTTPAFTLT